MFLKIMFVLTGLLFTGGFISSMLGIWLDSQHWNNTAGISLFFAVALGAGSFVSWIMQK